MVIIIIVIISSSSSFRVIVIIVSCSKSKNKFELFFPEDLKADEPNRTVVMITNIVQFNSHVQAQHPKTISNQKSEDETLILHGVLNTIKFEEDSLESALDILLTEEQKQKRAIEYYSYIAELSAQNDDGTASIYKYEGSVHLSDGKSLHIKIDYGASAVEKLTKRKLEFVFLCD